MPKRLTRVEKRELTRQALLDAATRLFAQKGYAATTVEDIAELAGMTRGAVYSNFTSKQDLLFAVTYRVTRVFDDPIFGDRSLSYPARLRLYARHLLEDWKEVRLAVLLYSELELLAARDAKVRAHLSKLITKDMEGTGRIMEEGAAQEGIHVPLGALNTLVVVSGAVRGLLRQRMLTPGFVDEKLLGDTLLLICGYDPSTEPLPE